MKETEIKNLIYEAVLKIQPNFGNEIHLTVPQLQFGDFSSNIALILAKTLKRNPMEVGEAIKSKIENLLTQYKMYQKGLSKKSFTILT